MKFAYKHWRVFKSSAGRVSHHQCLLIDVIQRKNKLFLIFMINNNSAMESKVPLKLGAYLSMETERWGLYVSS